MFRDANGVVVPVMDLSDGYRSVLSMTFEIVRQMAMTFGPDEIFDPNDPAKVVPEGVVIVDEVDTHLHPTWQSRIGHWFCDHFPNVQFIVSTHSPLVCQSAENGSVYLLPRSGTREKGGKLKRDTLLRLVHGTVLDAYGTEAFGSDAAATQRRRDRQGRGSCIGGWPSSTTANCSRAFRRKRGANANGSAERCRRLRPRSIERASATC